MSDESIFADDVTLGEPFVIIKLSELREKLEAAVRKLCERTDISLELAPASVIAEELAKELGISNK